MNKIELFIKYDIEKYNNEIIKFNYLIIFYLIYYLFFSK
jgi:hypothetical protein